MRKGFKFLLVSAILVLSLLVLTGCGNVADEQNQPTTTNQLTTIAELATTTEPKVTTEQNQPTTTTEQKDDNYSLTVKAYNKEKDL